MSQSIKEAGYVEAIYQTPAGKQVIVRFNRKNYGRATVPYTGHILGERVTLTKSQGAWREAR